MNAAIESVGYRDNSATCGCGTLNTRSTSTSTAMKLARVEPPASSDHRQDCPGKRETLRGLRLISDVRRGFLKVLPEEAEIGVH